MNKCLKTSNCTSQFRYIPPTYPFHKPIYSLYNNEQSSIDTLFVNLSTQCTTMSNQVSIHKAQPLRSFGSPRVPLSFSIHDHNGTSAFLGSIHMSFRIR